jgi:hypothetical protein
MSPTTAEIPEITRDVVLDSLALHGIDGLELARALAKDTFARPPPPSPAEDPNGDERVDPPAQRA